MVKKRFIGHRSVGNILMFGLPGTEDECEACTQEESPKAP